MKNISLKRILFLSLLCFSYSFIFSQSTAQIKEIELSPPYKVEVYTMPFCGHCKVVESRLKKHKIKYEDKNIFLFKNSHKEMMTRTNGEDGAPEFSSMVTI